MVSAPVVEYLHRDGKLHITAASHLKDESDKLAQRYPGVESIYLNVTENPCHLSGLCEDSDVVSTCICSVHNRHIIAHGVFGCM